MQPPLTRSYPPIPALETQTDTILTSINMVDAHCSEDTSTSYIVKAVLSEYWKDISMTFKKFSSDKNPTAVDDSKKAPDAPVVDQPNPQRSEEHTSELQSLMRISYAVFCLQKNTKQTTKTHK